MTTTHSDTATLYSPTTSCDSVCSLDLVVPFSQAMHCSKSFRALVLFGVVALVTAFYQSMTPLARTVTTGPKPRQRVEQRGPVSFDSDASVCSFGSHLSPTHTLCRGPYPFCTQSLFSMHTTLLAYRSYSSGTAEVAAKTVTSWFNALDMPIKDQCGLFDVGALRYDQCGPLDAPKDNQCAPNEPVIASTEAFATVRVGITRTIALSVHLEYAPCSTNSCRALFSLHTLGQAVGVPDDASKRFGRSAPLDAVATERAGLRVDENEGVACPPWWLPPFMANHGQFHSDNEVLAHIDVHDGKPHRDLMSHESAEQPKPADSPSRDETIGLWISSALLCTFILLLGVYAFNGKVHTLPFSCSQRALFFHLLHPAPCTPAPPSPCSLHTSGHSRTLNVEFRTMYSQDRARKKGAKALNLKARSPEVYHARQCMMLQLHLVIAFLPASSTKHRPPPIFLHTGVAASGDGDRAHDHGQRVSDDDGGAALARHREADWRASGVVCALSRQPTDVRHVGGERRYFWQHD